MPLPVLLTGATQRLGLAMAESLLSQNTPIVVTYRTPKQSIHRLEQKGAILIRADFSTQAAIDRAIDEIIAVSPYYRALIHNASDWAQEADNDNYDSLMEQMMRVHVFAPYRINMALETALTHREGPADIIHMTDYVQQTGSAKHVAYAASKAALHNLTLSFAKRLAPSVKVNSIAPALLMFNSGDDEAYREKALKKSLLEIVPGADEAVKAMNYLLESDYITGQTVHLNGGRHLK
ncbi:dihydromonapterin reductase [Alteromonas sp. 345S023]|uniref:Dihydromonapterin reductase n=1 Tax=Alteromonas profundi TaxID=2696062 RepID=A0A7X5RMF4_9ALTE|nr:dihydromonapterin reductase [Alteromonas profundi]NDV92927.1 dihydromonapterin reductase [Alteromonas profundi]